MNERAPDGVRVHVAKWGTSLAVRIPKPIAEQWGVVNGSVIDIVLRGDRVILSRRPHSLAEMMSRVIPDNLHAELGTGRPVGNEAW